MLVTWLSIAPTCSRAQNSLPMAIIPGLAGEKRWELPNGK